MHLGPLMDGMFIEPARMDQLFSITVKALLQA